MTKETRDSIVLLTGIAILVVVWHFQADAYNVSKRFVRRVGGG